MAAFTNVLTPVFKDFAINLNSHDLKDTSYKLPTYTKYRIVISRLYYSLFHKALENFPSIRNDKEGKKHSRTLDALFSSADPNHKTMHTLLSELKDLREWADYDHDDSQFTKAFPNPNIGYYIYRVNSCT